MMETGPTTTTTVDTNISPPLSESSPAVIRARGGVVSGRVLLMLVSSTTLAIIAIIAVWFAS